MAKKTYFFLCVHYQVAPRCLIYFIRVVDNCIYCATPVRKLFVFCVTMFLILNGVRIRNEYTPFDRTPRGGGDSLNVKGRYINTIKIHLSEIRL
jgi:hypothetical protein